MGRVFLPWERRGRPLGLFGRARGRTVALAICVLGLVGWVLVREEHRASVRATRAALSDVDRALMAFRLDHPNQCPSALEDLAAQGYVHEVPLDAWGRPLRLECPSARAGRAYELTSDGPDGLPGGLDRIE